MSYQPIENYGIIGDMRTAALVGMNGSIDWCCLPHFDSPSIFGRLLDENKGGFFQLAPSHDGEVKQMYLPNTNVLVTRFLGDQGMGEVIDFMSVGREAGGQTSQSARQIVRIAKAIRGAVTFHMECRPAFDYARQKHQVELSQDGKCAVFSCGPNKFALKSSHAMQVRDNGLFAEFNVDRDQPAMFILRHDESGEGQLTENGADAHNLLTETVRFWRDWAGRSRYHGRWREMVTRSALVLKLLTFLPTGAIVAAPTTSLPESVGGVRNWDYRYTWVRDAAFTVYSLMRLGYTEEAGAFAQFMQARAKEEEPDGGPLNVLYAIDGSHHAREETLDHLDGYRGSKPVRIGNAAVGHYQLDIYGELMDALYLYDKYGAPLSYDMWVTIEHMLDWLVQHWRDPDQSIWEVRGPRRNFTFSRLQSWVALDRGVRLARKRSFPTESDNWRFERNKIYTAIMNESWNEKVGAFTQYPGSEACDASLLMAPLMLFVSPSDPRMLSTLDVIQRELASDSLVLRYQTNKASADGLPGAEGYFSVCSFWMVEAMTRAGRVEEGQLLFEKLLSYANHLGLFSEEIGSKGQLLGNYPQALTHLGLISAAHNLDLLLDGRG
ncbi:MAG TPA: glycoside hydrolase family 15 protein [Bryobacteraceae bacterium]|jgi:GH15 family glucan-1,4-alpha-glucosidase|nr:glycoside hydrolase family 15 protein [Bryobacteraceae bacterium]